MRRSGCLVLAGLAATLTLLWQSPVSARADSGSSPAGVVFVQNNNTAGNAIAAYAESSDGTLALAKTYATGGNGGKLNGAVVDYLASQGSLVYDPARSLLFAVNAGSDTVTVFGVKGTHLTRLQVVSSNGAFPVSIARHADLVYVLNALGGGSVSGYRIVHKRLVALAHSTRKLHLDIPTNDSQYTDTPGQVSFSPNGALVLVTTKFDTSDIDVFAVNSSGQLSSSPVVNPEPGTAPFSGLFSRNDQFVVSDPAIASVSTYSVSASGSLAEIETVATHEIKTCWITRSGRYLFASNPGAPGVPHSATVSTIRLTPSGTMTLVGTTRTDKGTVDLAATPNGKFLYVQTGLKGIVDEFSVGASGGLTDIGSVRVAGAVGGEGIVAL